MATATYLIVGIGIRIYREIDERRFLREADLEAFGIKVDSPLAARNSTQDLVEDTFGLSDSPFDLSF